MIATGENPMSEKLQNQVYMTPLPNVRDRLTIKLSTVRALLVLRGDSLNAWSKRCGYSRAHVARSLRGDYKGHKAIEAVNKLRIYLGI
jgi:nitrite reductase/ring-hydroxylating ferredoxin subunit